MKKIYFLVLSCAVLFGFASCLSDNDDDKGNKLLMNDYFTIVGSYPDYKLVGDGNIILYPTIASVNELTNSSGFGDHKRAMFYAYYYTNDMTTENGATVIRNAELESGVYTAEQKAITAEEANKAGILAEDSTFNIKGSNSWLINGYFTSIFKADYSIVDNKDIEPHANLCATSTGENAVTLTLLYNRHTAQSGVYSYEGTFIYSFDVTNLEIPGNDSITVSFEVKGATSSKLKVSRRDFYNHAQ